MLCGCCCIRFVCALLFMVICLVVYFGCFMGFGVLGVFYLGGVVDVGLLVLLAFVLDVALWICCFDYVSLV